MSGILAAAAINVPTVVTLSGETISNVNGVSGIRFNTDGTIDQRIDASYFQIDADTDWIIPNTRAGDGTGYEVRMTNLVGNSFDSEPAVEDAWVDLSSNREWHYTPSASKSCTCDFEIRLASSTTLASTGYTISVTVI